MKAKELVKKSVKIEDIYLNIEERNKMGEFKIFYPCYIYVSDEVVMQLINEVGRIIVDEDSIEIYDDYRE